MTLIEAPIGSIQPDPGQPRKTFDDLEHEALVQSIEQHGVLTPITLRKNGDGFVIVAGERRWRAAKAAKRTTIPALVIEAEDDTDQQVKATVENVLRSDLNPVEEGHAYVRISHEDKHPGAAERVAKLVNRPVERVEKRMALTKLPQVTQDAIAAGRINLAAAETHVELLNKLGEKVLTRVGELIVARPDDAGAWSWADALTAAQRSAYLDLCATCGGDGKSRRTDWQACGKCKGVGGKPKKEPDFFLLNFRVKVDEAVEMVEPFLSDEAQIKLRAAVEHHEQAQAKAKSGDTYGYYPTLQSEWLFNMIDADAAKAFGGTYSATDRDVWTVEAEWLGENLTVGIEQAAKAYDRQAKKKQDAKPKSAGTASDADKEKRKRDRAKALKDAEAARAHNVAVGVALAKWTPRAKADVLDGVKHLAVALLTHKTEWGIGENADHVARALHLTDETLTVNRYKAGGFKGVGYERDPAKREKLAKDAVAAVERATTVEEVLAAAFRPMLAAKLVKRDGMPGADANGTELPTGLRGPRLDKLAAKVNVK